MRDSTDGSPIDPLDPQSDDPGDPRKPLEEVFKDGVRAREAGTPSCDNPYAAGSPERQEWSAGWSATVRPDGQDEPNSGYVKN